MPESSPSSHSCSPTHLRRCLGSAIVALCLRARPSSSSRQASGPAVLRGGRSQAGQGQGRVADKLCPFRLACSQGPPPRTCCVESSLSQGLGDPHLGSGRMGRALWPEAPLGFCKCRRTLGSRRCSLDQCCFSHLPCVLSPGTELQPHLRVRVGTGGHVQTGFKAESDTRSRQLEVSLPSGEAPRRPAAAEQRPFGGKEDICITSVSF